MIAGEPVQAKAPGIALPAGDHRVIETVEVEVGKRGILNAHDSDTIADVHM